MYETFYGLRAKPFQLTPDPSFFYASRLHKRAVSYLQYGLSQAEGFIVITGDIGTGKTTIANNLLQSVEQDIEAAQIVTPKLSPDELLKMVASKFNLNVNGMGKSEILQMLQRYLYRLSTQGKRALLLVDEAQNLPLETIEELRMLSNFQEKGKPLLQSFLLGQAELQGILRSPDMEQFRQRIVASCHLPPLDQEEVIEYIDHRIHHAGYRGKPLFCTGGYALIFEHTKGVPRRINTLMDRMLLFGFLEELSTFTVEQVQEVINEVSGEGFDSGSQPASAEDGLPANAGGAFAVTGDASVDVEYYKSMINELVSALDDAVKHKIKLTQYIDRLLKKRYQAYVRLKGED